MAVPGAGDPVASPGLFYSFRSFWGVLISIFQTRLDLVTMELEEEAARAIKLVLVAFASLLFLVTAFFFAMLFLLAAVWDTAYRLPVLGGVFGVYALIGLGLLLAARQMILHRPKFLSQTLAELKKDVENVQTLVKVPESKP